MTERITFMGLAASQAKLLSITSRLSDNELRSQSLTAAKLALSSQTADASRKYINALNRNELVYRTYDEAGNKVFVPLTGAQLTSYGEIKNQYGIINNKGQILVSETDAANYKDSANVLEFIQKYGFSNEFKEEVAMQINQGEYNKAMQDYYGEMENWQSKEPQQSDYGTTIKEKIENPLPKPDPTDEKYWIKGVDHSSLYQQFLDSASHCFDYTISGASGYSHTNCFMHVLVNLIGPGEHTTSSGEKFEAHPNSMSWNWNATYDSWNESLTEACKNAPCSGDVIPGGVETVTTSYGTVEVGGPPSDPNMSVYQRAVDLLWEVHTRYKDYDTASPDVFGGEATAEDMQKFFYFVEHDLKHIEPTEEFDQDQFDKDMAEWEEYENKWTTEFIPDEDAYNEAHDEWEKQEPEKPNPDDYMEKSSYVEQDLKDDTGRWYIDLWHRMNGMSNYKVTMDDFDNGVHDPSSDGLIEGDNVKSPTNGRTVDGLPLWDVLEDGLMNSQEWLKYALETGTVTLERVNYTNPTEYGTGMEPLNNTWTSIVYTNALEISQQVNDRAISIAEAEYEQKTREIEAKDKQYDSMLKLLDTEHSALQQEYESAKAVIQKNTERTLKIYSA